MTEEYKSSGRSSEISFEMKENCIYGTIKYHPISAYEALCDVNLHMQRVTLKKIMKQRKEKSYLLMMIDKSSSMAGRKMERTKMELKKFIKGVLSSKRKVITVLFDHKICIIEENDWNTYEQLIDEHFVVGAGTSYKLPMKYLLELIQTRDI